MRRSRGNAHLYVKAGAYYVRWRVDVWFTGGLLQVKFLRPVSALSEIEIAGVVREGPTRPSTSTCGPAGPTAGSRRWQGARCRRVSEQSLEPVTYRRGHGESVLDKPNPTNLDKDLQKLM